MNLARALAGQVHEALADTPVVVINGARQVGKSTLVQSINYPGSVEILTLDHQATRAAAANDPRSFVRRTSDTLVIDEVQLEPTLFRAIKAEVDADRRPGRFLLTGSTRLLSAPDMADSLVGRVEILDLWPFSEGELTGNNRSIVDAISVQPESLVRSSTLDRAELCAQIARGGFPAVVERSPTRRRRWFDAYATTSIERVVRQLADLERLAEIPRLLRLCAARTATELNVTSIASQLGMPQRTTDAYLAHLAAVFVVQLIPAWATNLSAKVIRRPKILVSDTGLTTSLIGASLETLGRPDGPLGQLLETFVFMELIKQITWSDQRPSVGHFRDRSGAEVDIVLEYPDGRVVGIEVKATSSPRPADATGLRLLADRLGERFHYGYLATTAPEAYPLGPRIAAIPVDALWR